MLSSFSFSLSELVENTATNLNVRNATCTISTQSTTGNLQAQSYVDSIRVCDCRALGSHPWERCNVDDPSLKATGHDRQHPWSGEIRQQRPWEEGRLRRCYLTLNTECRLFLWAAAWALHFPLHFLHPLPKSRTFLGPGTPSPGTKGF